MKWIEVQSSGPLRGTVKIQGSKNSSLALLAAACLASTPVRLQGLPNIQDLRLIRDLLCAVGARVDITEEGDWVIDPREIHTGDLPIELTSAYRASYYFIGGLLASRKRVRIGYPGGDDFVSRPIDQHLKLFQAMGADVRMAETYYEVTAETLKGATVFFDVITSGATMNALLLAAQAEGTTVLHNCATDPEVVDTANLLNQMGAVVRGAGTSTIRVEGVKRLLGCAYTVIPDRLIAGAFLMAAGVTRGEVKVEGVIPEHLSSCLTKLTEIGLNVLVEDSSVTVSASGKLKAVRVRTGMYPGFATDLQQPLTPLLLTASGKSLITEKVYPKRFMHVPQLVRMGADITLRGSTAHIMGDARLRGTHVHASDIRAGVGLILAGLAAEGVTRIGGVEHVERGYENAIGAFRSLGAEIRIVEDEPIPAHGRLSLA